MNLIIPVAIAISHAVDSSRFSEGKNLSPRCSITACCRLSRSLIDEIRAFAGKPVTLLARPLSRTHDRRRGRSTKESAASWAADLAEPRAEEGFVVVEHLLECRGRVVVKIRGGPADAAQLGDVHHAEVRGLAREKQSSRIRSGDELEGAVGACDAIRARVTRQPLRTWRIAVRGRARTSGRDAVIAHDGAHDRRLGRRPARMQRAAMALGAGAVENYFALLLKLIQFGVRVRERRRAGEDRVGQQFDRWRRNSVCWKAARSSSIRCGGSTDTWACAKSAPRACSWSVPKRASCW